MAGIFICYRRADAAGWAGRLSADLKAGLRGVEVFMDIDAIPPGVAFDEYISQAVGSCETLIVLIGPHWLSAVDKDGRPRLHDPDDVTRLEIATALKRDIRVIPALVGGAKVPTAEYLPADLKSLARRQAYELSDHRWAADCKSLIEALAPIVRQRHRALDLKVLGAVALALLLAVGGWWGVKFWRADGARRAEGTRQAEEARKAEQARAVEQARQAEEARQAKDARKAEEARKVEDARRAEEARKAGETRAAEQARQAEETRRTTEARRAAAARLMDIRNRADVAQREALTWQTRAEQSAQAAQRDAEAAQAVARSLSTMRFPSREVSERAQPIVLAARKGGVTAVDAARRAAEALKSAQDAAATAKAKAGEAAAATDAAVAAAAAADAGNQTARAKTAAGEASEAAAVAREQAAANNRAQSQVSAIAGASAPPPARNNIRNIRAVNLSDTELRVTADYSYIGDQGVDNGSPLAAICIYGADGRQTPGTTCVRQGPLRVGDGSVTFTVRMLPSATGPYRSSEVRVCMVGREKFDKVFYCQSLAYTKVWSQ
jgi:hypothetical protein